MENTATSAGIFGKRRSAEQISENESVFRKEKMTLLEANIQQEYIIKEINTDDEEMNAFLFRLGCYSGEPITIISKKKKSCIVVIKDGRYTLDNLLCEAIIV